MPELPAFSESDQARARQWFQKARDSRDRREYDYAIQLIIEGLSAWPEAVEEGHKPLRSIAVQRAQAGGKKPSMMDAMKYSTSGKDHKQAMLNAELLWAKDQTSASYAEALLRNAVKAGYMQTVLWIAPLLLELLRAEKKPDKAKFKAFRALLVEAADKVEAAGAGPLMTPLLEQAVNSLDFLVMRLPDEELRQEQRNLSGRLTIHRGKYSEAGNFRDSLRDADKQKLLHDAERGNQGEQTFDALLKAARTEYEADPTSGQKLNAYVDTLLKGESRKYEDEAVRVLRKAAGVTSNYSFRMRADDIVLRQLGKQVRDLAEKAAAGGADDQQQLRLAQMEQRMTALDIYRERIANYPSDLRLKLRLGQLLYEAGEYDEAIPLLQQAQADPRGRTRCLLLIGQCFLEKGLPADAVEVISEAAQSYELTDDLSKEMLYWWARALEACGRTEEARQTYGKLLRQEYNYGDARKRVSELK